VRKERENSEDEVRYRHYQEGKTDKEEKRRVAEVWGTVIYSTGSDKWTSKFGPVSILITKQLLLVLLSLRIKYDAWKGDLPV
jgi:hypothetical protein